MNCYLCTKEKSTVTGLHTHTRECCRAEIIEGRTEPVAVFLVLDRARPPEHISTLIFGKHLTASDIGAGLT